MTSIFVSHSSLEDHLATKLEKWLVAEGFGDVFVDHSAMRTGEHWRDRLRQDNGSCRVVLCLVTANWLNSDECYGEYMAGWTMGKRIMPLLACNDDDLNARQMQRLGRILQEDQGLNVTTLGAPGTLNFDADPVVAGALAASLRASGAVEKLGLDPHAFEIDRNTRPEPFLGLESFGDTEADAAIFFGRSAEIAQGLEDLREMRAGGDRRAYAILGASGSGKSSLLKAGIAPRLRRERGWVVLRSFRPGGDPLFNFCQALSQSGLKVGAGTLRDAFLQASRDKADLCETLERHIAPLRKVKGASATVLIVIDQGEELARAEGENADVLSAILREALAAQTGLNNAPNSEVGAMPYGLIMSIRTDSFPELQSSRHFEGLLCRTHDLRTLPNFRYDNAVESPAQRYGVEINPDLVEALMDDAVGKDALPLLAYTMQRLWRQYAKDRHITRTHYENIGKLSGLINDAAERALNFMEPVAYHEKRPEPPIDRIRIAASTFIPAMAQVNERGDVIRRLADFNDLSAAKQELLGWFEKWRLVVRTGATIEVAHEAMFRVWERLKGWLDDEKSHMEIIRDVELAAATWQNSKNKDDLRHTGKNIRKIRRLLRRSADYKAQLTRNADATAYYKNCEKSRLHSLLKRYALGATTITLIFGVGAMANGYAERSSMLEAGSGAVKEGRPLDALPFMVAGLPETGTVAAFDRLAPGNRLAVIRRSPFNLVADIGTRYHSATFLSDRYLLLNPAAKAEPKGPVLYDLQGRQQTDLGQPTDTSSPVLALGENKVLVKRSGRYVIHDLANGTETPTGLRKITQVLADGISFVGIDQPGSAIELNSDGDLLATLTKSNTGYLTRLSQDGTWHVSITKEGFGTVRRGKTGTTISLGLLAINPTPETNPTGQSVVALTDEPVFGYPRFDKSSAAHLAAVRKDGTGIVVDLNSGEVVELGKMPTIHTDQIEIDSAKQTPFPPYDIPRFSAGGRYLAYQNAEGAHLRDLATGVDRLVDGRFTPGQSPFDDNGMRVISSNSTAVYFSDTAGTDQQKIPGNFTRTIVHGNTALLIKQNKKSIILGVIRNLQKKTDILIDDLESVDSLTLSSDGQWAAWVDTSQRGFLRKIVPGAKNIELASVDGSVAFSDNSRWAYFDSPTRGRTLLALDKGGAEIRIGRAAQSGNLVFSPNGKYAASEGADSFDFVLSTENASMTASRSSICDSTSNMRPIGWQERTGSEVPDALHGRPWNPCDWRGLWAFLPDPRHGDNWFEGAHQFWRRVMVVTGLNPKADYTCEETTMGASQSTKQARKSMCDRFGKARKRRL